MKEGQVTRPRGLPLASFPFLHDPSVPRVAGAARGSEGQRLCESGGPDQRGGHARGKENGETPGHIASQPRPFLWVLRAWAWVFAMKDAGAETVTRGR